MEKIQTYIITEIPITTEVIIYISGGLLGDFFHQLSIIKENYINTGKKGILYLSNVERFRNDLATVYKDTYEIIILQEYILKYEIHNNQHFNINLSSWRQNKYLWSRQIIYTFKDEYGIDFGKHKWLTNIENNIEWNDKIIINTTSYRFPDDPKHLAFYNKLFNEMPHDKIIFVSAIEEEYINFMNKTNLKINYYKPASLMDLCIVINSCKLFLGSLSSPMSIATALHKKCIYPISTNLIEQLLFSKMDTFIPTITYL